MTVDDFIAFLQELPEDVREGEMRVMIAGEEQALNAIIVIPPSAPDGGEPGVIVAGSWPPAPQSTEVRDMGVPSDEV